MSRTVKLHRCRRNIEGKVLCRVCGAVVLSPRRSFCTAECADLYWHEQPSFYRPLVEKRDKGVCAECGCDTSQIERVLRHLDTGVYYSSESTDRASYSLARETMQKHLEALGFILFRSLWEADHILEVVRGGTSDLANLQTLCVPCHKAKTKRLAQERAQERRAANGISADSFRPICCNQPQRYMGFYPDYPVQEIYRCGVCGRDEAVDGQMMIRFEVKL